MIENEITGISLIVATLGKCDMAPFLDSLDAQTCDKYECIVIDQSPDRRAEDMVREYRNVRYLHSSRKGNSFNRNVGIRHALFPIVGFPDDDCMYERDVIERALEAFGKVPRDVAGISGVWMDSLSRRVAMGPKKERYANRLNVWSSVTNITMFLRADVVREVKGYDEEFGLGSNVFEGGEETDLVLKVLESGKKILYLPQVRVWHRQDKHVLNNPMKQWGYEESWGALFRKWSTQGPRRSIVIFTFAFFVLRSFFAAITWMLRGNFVTGGLYLNKNKARFRGWSKFAHRETHSHQVMKEDFSNWL